MESKFLLSNRFKKIGWIMLAISIIIWSYVTFVFKDDFPFLETNVFTIVGSEFLQSDITYFSFVKANITFTLVGGLFLVGGLLVVFSKEKIEDEYISKLRLQAFQWAFISNYIILLLLFLFVYGIEFFQVMLYNMFTMMILFIIRFQYLLYINKN